MTRFDITKLPMNMRGKILPCEDHSFKSSQCWEWFGALNSKGYGSMAAGVKGKTMLAHRKAFEVVVGTIPAGLTIDHLCFNKVCMNTDHMEPVTAAENTRRASARITHCKQGHPLSGPNVRLKQRRNGWTQRVCLACQRVWGSAHRARKRAERAVVPSE